MASAETDVTQNGATVFEDGFADPLVAAENGPRIDRGQSRIGAIFILLAVFFSHIGIWTLLNAFDFGSPNLPNIQEIPVDLVTEMPDAKKPPPKPSPSPHKPEEAAPQPDKPAESPPPKAAEAQTQSEKSAAAAEKPAPTAPPASPAVSPAQPSVSDEKPAPQANATPATPPDPPKPAPRQADSKRAAPPPDKPPQHSERAKAAAANPARPEPAPAQPPEQKAGPIGGLAPAPDAPRSPQALPQFAQSSETFQAVALPQSSDDGDDPTSYSMLVFSRLELAKRFPKAALDRGAHGSAGIGFTIDDKGNVLDAELLVSSGDPDLDEESVALIRRAAPFPPPPPGAEHRFDAVVTFDQVDVQSK